MAAIGMPYSNRSCTTGCTSFDQHYLGCHPARKDLAFTRCVCSELFTKVLFTCTVCDAADLGGNSLALYQDWTVGCYALTYQGLALPGSFIEDDAGNGFAQTFSSSVLPQIRTAFEPTGTIVVVSAGSLETGTRTPPTTAPAGGTSVNMGSATTSAGVATPTASGPTTSPPLSSSAGQAAAPTTTTTTTTTTSGPATPVRQSHPAAQYMALLAAVGALLGLV